MEMHSVITAPSAIRVLIADDHPVVRTGIRDELAKHRDLQLIGEATDGDHTLELVERTQPDVLVLDINMPGMPAVKLVRRLQDQPRAPRILVLSAYADLESVQAMLRAGVQGYMLKDEDPARIPEGIRAVSNGIRWLSDRIGTIITQDPFRREAASELSPRETEVLQLIALGKGNDQIADDLSIVVGTVKNHVSSIYMKLGVRTRAEAVAWAWRHGIVSGPLPGPAERGDRLR